MKQIINYIQEKLKITSKSKINKFVFHKNDKTQPIYGYNWLLNNEYLKPSLTILKWAFDNCELTKIEKIFILNFIQEIEEFYSQKRPVSPSTLQRKTEILNGKPNNGHYRRVKCIYDICKIIKDNDIFIKNKYGKSLNDEVDNIIFELENLTKGNIKNIDWSH